MTLENVIICFAGSPHFELRMCLNCDTGALRGNTLFLAHEMSKNLHTLVKFIFSRFHADSYRLRLLLLFFAKTKAYNGW